MLGALSSARRPPPRRGRGVTIVELMVTLAIVAVLAAIALPSMNALIARKRLEGLAQELATDLRLLKSHQVHNRPNSGTAIIFGSSTNNLCYLLYVPGDSGDNCSCSEPFEQQACVRNAGIEKAQSVRQVDIPRSNGIEIITSPNRLIVDGYNGLPQAAQTLRVRLVSSTAGEIVISTNATGVPSMCSVSGSFGSIKACPP